MSDVRVLLAVIDNDEIALRGRLLNGLQPCELARRFRTTQDRAQFVVGRALIRYGLQVIFGVVASSIDIGKHGKPFLSESVRSGIDFSLAHSSEIVVCAFAQGSIVGVDVERFQVDGIADIASSYFSVEERSALLHVAADKRFDYALRLWTLKEAAAKAVGLGLQLPLDSFVFALDPPRLLSAGAELGDIALWHFEERMFANARIALAAKPRNSEKLKVAFKVVSLSSL